MKNTKKIILGLGATAAVVTPIVATVSCSLFGGSSNGKSSRQFWNYEDYIDEDIKNNIQGSYTYSEFGDLPEFRQALIDKTAAAGVGSDYFNAKLAEDGYIQKLDFGRLYGITNDRSQWESILSKYYTKEAWDLLSNFNLHGYGERIASTDDAKLSKEDKDYIDNNGGDKTKLPEHDVDGDGTSDFLWEFMAPYFMQNKVVAINLKDLAPAIAAKTSKSVEDVMKMSNDDVNALFADKTYAGILKQLKNDYNVTSFTINDYMRDNMMIGSENADGSVFTSTVKDVKDGEAQLDSFMTKVKLGWRLQWETSGVDTLESITKNDRTSQAALMYNGDALAAYNGGYEEGSETGNIRVILPKNATFMCDGFVISSDIKNDRVEMDRIYDVAKNTLYKGVNTTYKADANATPFAGYISENNVYKNFDYVGYTAAFSQLYSYVMDGDNYFDGDNDKFISAATEKAAAALTSKKIDADHTTSVIDDNWTIQLGNYYESKK